MKITCKSCKQSLNFPSLFSKSEKGCTSMYVGAGSTREGLACSASPPLPGLSPHAFAEPPRVCKLYCKSDAKLRKQHGEIWIRSQHRAGFAGKASFNIGRSEIHHAGFIQYAATDAKRILVPVNNASVSPASDTLPCVNILRWLCRKKDSNDKMYNYHQSQSSILFPSFPGKLAGLGYGWLWLVRVIHPLLNKAKVPLQVNQSLIFRQLREAVPKRLRQAVQSSSAVKGISHFAKDI